jgi:hypothetical protein
MLKTPGTSIPKRFQPSYRASRQPPRNCDRLIMESFAPHVTDPEHFISLNKCRLFLKAMYLSDIVDGSGSYILEEAWQPRTQRVTYRDDSWPNQGLPNSSAWILWRKYLKIAFISRDLRLCQPLGTWIGPDNDWPWYFCNARKLLMQLMKGRWFSFIICILRPRFPIYYGQPSIASAPTDLYRATIRLQGNDIICTGIGKVQHDMLPSTDDFQKFVLAAHPQNAWCTENVEIANVEALINAIQIGKIRAVSDGSYKDS